MTQMPRDRGADCSDEALLKRYAAGEPLASRLLTDRLLPRVYATAYRLLNDRAEAEDVAQEAMLKLWRIAPEWQYGRAKITTWLYRVTSNLAIDRMRKTSRLTLPGEMPEIADSKANVAEQLIEKKRKMVLASALSELPERQRLAVEMRLIEGFSNPEIAETLGITVAAVESLTARGKRALTIAIAARRDELGYEE